MTTRKVGNLEGSMTHPSVAASAEVAVYASWAEIANMPIIDFPTRFAKKKNATPAQISLAWLLAQKPFIVPIPGTRNIDHLHENGAAINVQLASEDLQQIDSALSKIKVYGGRMNEEQMKVVDQT